MSVEGAHLECVVKKHPALDSAMHLLPENALVSGDENIPGLMSSPTGKSHQLVSGEKPKKKWNSVKIGINRIKDHRRTVEKRKLQADGQTACCASSQILFTALSLNLFDMFWCSLTTSSLQSPKHLMGFFWHRVKAKNHICFLWQRQFSSFKIRVFLSFTLQQKHVYNCKFPITNRRCSRPTLMYLLFNFMTEGGGTYWHEWVVKCACNELGSIGQMAAG